MYKIYSINNEEIGIFINLRNLEVNHKGELLHFDDYLNKIKDYKKTILVNIIPIDTSSSNIIDITKENSDYIEKIYNIINLHRNLNLEFCSTSTRILKILEKKFINNICGYFVSNDLNNPNTKLYVIPIKKFNYKRLYQNRIIYIFINEYINDIKNEELSDIYNYSNIYIIKKTQ